MSGNGTKGKVLVIGGGISGLTSAIEAAEGGVDRQRLAVTGSVMEAFGCS